MNRRAHHATVICISIQSSVIACPQLHVNFLCSYASGDLVCAGSLWRVLDAVARCRTRFGDPAVTLPTPIRLQSPSPSMSTQNNSRELRVLFCLALLCSRFWLMGATLAQKWCRGLRSQVDVLRLRSLAHRPWLGKLCRPKWTRCSLLPHLLPVCLSGRGLRNLCWSHAALCKPPLTVRRLYHASTPTGSRSWTVVADLALVRRRFAVGSTLSAVVNVFGWLFPKAWTGGCTLLGSVCHARCCSFWICGGLCSPPRHRRWVRLCAASSPILCQWCSGARTTLDQLFGLATGVDGPRTPVTGYPLDDDEARGGVVCWVPV